MMIFWHSSFESFIYYRLTSAPVQIYDASYEWITTQGWSFLPLDNYGGGGTEAKFRPLEVNYVDYDLAWCVV